MKFQAQTKFPYTAFDTYCIRSPILTLNFYSKLFASDEISDDELHEQLEDPLVAEAIYLASPELSDQLVKWKKGFIKEEKKKSRLRIALLKYLTRMATRCTPFGLFATVGSGKVGKESESELLKSQPFGKLTQFDMQFLVAFGDALVKKPHIKNQLLFYPNSSIYRIGKRYRYVEYSFENKKRTYSIESVAHSSYLEELLKTAANGATLEVLTTQLVDQDIEKTEAGAFIDQLVDNQILVSELEPSIAGNDYLSVLKEKLNQLNHTEQEIETITKLQSSISKLDEKVGASVTDYLPLKNLISQSELPFEPKFLLQTDTFANYKTNTLSYTVVSKVRQALAFFNKLTDSTSGGALTEFKSKFAKRFEHRKMPLSLILDVETGIGYGQNPTNLNATPYLDDVVYYGRNETNYSSVLNDPLQNVLQKKLAKALTARTRVIELKDEDFSNSDYEWTNAADTISVMTEVIFEEGKEKVIVSAAIEHAARLLGRFGHGDDDLKKLLFEISEKESEMNPNHVLAEIIHLPEARTGNILRRPEIREYEIPYLGKSSLPLEQQIPIDNILVSVENGLVVLYSKKFDKPIVPRLSNAHNVTDLALPIYRFLCSVQYQKQEGYGFAWPSTFYSIPFLPRVTYKDCILSRAKWNIEVADIKMLIEKFDNKHSLLKKTSKWQEALNIPEVVQLADGDNTLPVNLKNYSSICMLLDTVKNRPYFTLEEFFGLSEPSSNISKEEFGKQYILSFYNHTKLKKSDDQTKVSFRG